MDIDSTLRVYPSRFLAFEFDLTIGSNFQSSQSQSGRFSFCDGFGEPLDSFVFFREDVFYSGSYYDSWLRVGSYSNGQNFNFSGDFNGQLRKFFIDDSMVYFGSGDNEEVKLVKYCSGDFIKINDFKLFIPDFIFPWATLEKKTNNYLEPQETGIFEFKPSGSDLFSGVEILDFDLVENDTLWASGILGDSPLTGSSFLINSLVFDPREEERFNLKIKTNLGTFWKRDFLNFNQMFEQEIEIKTGSTFYDENLQTQISDHVISWSYNRDSSEVDLIIYAGNEDDSSLVNYSGLRKGLVYKLFDGFTNSGFHFPLEPDYYKPSYFSGVLNPMSSSPLVVYTGYEVSGFANIHYSGSVSGITSGQAFLNRSFSGVYNDTQGSGFYAVFNGTESGISGSLVSTFDLSSGIYLDHVQSSLGGLFARFAFTGTPFSDPYSQLSTGVIADRFFSGFITGTFDQVSGVYTGQVVPDIYVDISISNYSGLKTSGSFSGVIHPAANSGVAFFTGFNLSYFNSGLISGLTPSNLTSFSYSGINILGSGLRAVFQETVFPFSQFFAPVALDTGVLNFGTGSGAFSGSDGNLWLAITSGFRTTNSGQLIYPSGGTGQRNFSGIIDDGFSSISGVYSGRSPVIYSRIWNLNHSQLLNSFYSGQFVQWDNYYYSFFNYDIRLAEMFGVSSSQIQNRHFSGIFSSSSETGFIFHPVYPVSGLINVNYSNISGDNVSVSGIRAVNSGTITAHFTGLSGFYDSGNFIQANVTGFDFSILESDYFNFSGSYPTSSGVFLGYTGISFIGNSTGWINPEFSGIDFMSYSGHFTDPFGTGIVFSGSSGESAAFRLNLSGEYFNIESGLYEGEFDFTVDSQYVKEFSDTNYSFQISSGMNDSKVISDLHFLNISGGIFSGKLNLERGTRAFQLKSKKRNPDPSVITGDFFAHISQLNFGGSNVESDKLKTGFYFKF